MNIVIKFIIFYICKSVQQVHLALPIKFINLFSHFSLSLLIIHKFYLHFHPMFGFLTLFYAGLFFLNAIVILNRRRFLNKMKLPLAYEHRIYLGPSRQRLVDFINTTRTVFEIPLIFFNILCIAYEVFMG